MIDSPTGLYYGGEIAAPVFSEVMTQVVRILGLRPSEIRPALQPVKAPAATAARSLPPVPAVLASGKMAMPDLRGRTIREASVILGQAGLSMIAEGGGVAVRQSVPANTPVAAGTEITVQFEPR